MAKLVAFYSRAGENHFGGEMKRVEVGNTEKAAKMIAELTGADLFKIEQTVPYSENYRACVDQAKKDKQENARPALVRLPEDFDKYDDIYLGYPNYCGTMPMAVYTFLESLDFTGKRIHPFCTHEGGGLSGTEQDIRTATAGAIVEKGIAICGSCVDDAKPALEKWV